MKVEYILNNFFIETQDDLEFICEVINSKTAVKIGDLINYEPAQRECNKTQELSKELKKDIISNNKLYIVKPLDTMGSICGKLGLEHSELLKILDGQSLFIGKKIIY